MRLHDETVFWSPSIDVYRLEDRWVIYAELPGVAREDLEVEVGPTYVRISGRKRLPMKGISPRSLEIDTGRFQREIELQGRIDTSTARAVLNDGLLRIEAMTPAGSSVRIPVSTDPASGESDVDCSVETAAETDTDPETHSGEMDD